MMDTGPVVPDEDRGPYLMAMFWSWSGIAIVLTSLRFYTRMRIRGVGCDDWMMLLSVVLFVITSAFITYMCSIGGARHVQYLSQEQLLKALQWSWFSQPPAIFLFATTKASIAILTLRIISPTAHWHRRILYGTIATVFIANILIIVFTFAQCNPPRALWTPEIKGSCWDPTVQERVNYFLNACNIVADVVLAIIPSTFIPGLSLPLRKKIALCILLGFGIVAAVFGIVKTVYLSSLTKRSDFTWSAYDIQAWSGVEGFVLIFCGNLPPLQPLWDQIFNNRPINSHGRSHYASRDNQSISGKSTLIPEPEDMPSAYTMARCVAATPPGSFINHYSTRSSDNKVYAMTDITISRYNAK